MPFIRSSITLIVVMLWSVGVSAQCAGGEEVCLQESGSAATESADEPTTETFDEQQKLLVDGITRNLKQRRLTRPSGDNALDKIRQLREIHPEHDYAINGENYMASIFIRLGRQAVQRGDLDLASRRLLAAIRFNPNVARQAELKQSIASAARSQDAISKAQTATDYLPADTPESGSQQANEPTEQPSQQQTGEVNTANTEEADNSQTAAVESSASIATTQAVEQLAPVNDNGFVAPVMVAIPAGSFLMGSKFGEADEAPVHKVVLEAFSISKHEITMQQYRVFAVATGRPAPQYLAEDGNLPVSNVSWHDAGSYVRWLSEKTQRRFRLPTESEWEYAARAGTKTPYSTGDTLVGAANCAGCGGQWNGRSQAPVGSFAPNDFGLFDVHGNVWEWVRDCWTNNYEGRGDSAQAIEVQGCERRVLRGGAWYNNADYARSSYRGNESPSFRDGGVGFRVVHEGL